jgi:hypothetical protein
MAADKRKPKKARESRWRPADAERAKDPGPPYVVLWPPGADAERDASWPAAEKVAMLHVVQKLEAAGPSLGHPHSTAVQGDVGQGFRELRPTAGRSRLAPDLPSRRSVHIRDPGGRARGADRLSRLRRCRRAGGRAIQASALVLDYTSNAGPP